MLLHCIVFTQRIFLLQFFSSDKSTLSYITKIKIESTINRAKIHVFLSYHNLFDRNTVDVYTTKCVLLYLFTFGLKQYHDLN